MINVSLHKKYEKLDGTHLIHIKNNQSMNKDKTVEKILTGKSDRNIKFNDLRKLLLSYGFSERVRGDHFIFSKEHIFEIINLQPLKDGKCKTISG